MEQAAEPPSPSPSSLSRQSPPRGQAGCEGGGGAAAGRGPALQPLEAQLSRLRIPHQEFAVQDQPPGGSCSTAAATTSGNRSWTREPRRVWSSTHPPGSAGVKRIARRPSNFCPYAGSRSRPGPCTALALSEHRFHRGGRQGAMTGRRARRRTGCGEQPDRPGRVRTRTRTLETWEGAPRCLMPT